MPMPLGPHLDRLMEAIATEAEGQRALLEGDAALAEKHMWEAARLYRASWELAPRASYGRLIGMLKAAVIAAKSQPANMAEAGEVEASAEPRAFALYAREQVGDGGESAPAHYVLAIAALLLEEDEVAIAASEGMRSGSPAFVRAATAIAALARRDRDSYKEAVFAIVTDFEGRETHLTGVAIADTALMLERLARPRGLAAARASALMPRG